MIQVTATTTTVSASASGAAVVAAVSPGAVLASAVGGIGPQGIQGIQGPPGDALGAASDVELVDLAEGDTLRFSSGSWRNLAGQLLIDGGNYAFLLALFLS